MLPAKGQTGNTSSQSGQESYMSARTLLGLWLMALSPTPALADDFVPDDVIVSDPARDLPPPEFDQRC